MKAEMRREGIVKNLCTLVNEVNLHPDLLYHVLDSLLLMVTSSLENCEELWWEKGFSYLHTQLGVCSVGFVSMWHGLCMHVVWGMCLCLKNISWLSGVFFIELEKENIEELCP